MTRSAPLLGAGLLVLICCLPLVAASSLVIGSRSIPVADVIAAFTHYDPASTDHSVVRELRVPRTLIGIVAGAALGVSGALLQGVSRNPLADPGIMGINAGAAAALVGGIVWFGAGSVWFAFAGAAVATAAVYLVASLGRDGATPVKLALAGAAVTAALTSVTTAAVLLNKAVLNELRFWQVGSLAGRHFDVLWQVLPFATVGLLAALALPRLLNGLALGDDMAAALGQNVARTRVFVFAVVIVLCGAATAACGPIVFIGLVVPHIARAVCGPDYRWILAYTVVGTPLVLLGADILGRVALGTDAELDVGIVLGFLGAPVFVLLVRYQRMAEL